MTQPVTWRRPILLAAIAGGVFPFFLLVNVGGWRSRVLARLLRVENWPIVSIPTSELPTGPASYLEIRFPFSLCRLTH
jgi:hypothetical protein